VGGHAVDEQHGGKRRDEVTVRIDRMRRRVKANRDLFDSIVDDLQAISWALLQLQPEGPSADAQLQFLASSSCAVAVGQSVAS
jgi:hypothetical protein